MPKSDELPYIIDVSTINKIGDDLAKSRDQRVRMMAGYLSGYGSALYAFRPPDPLQLAQLSRALP
jgi:hypothetical protein